MKQTKQLQSYLDRLQRHRINVTVWSLIGLAILLKLIRKLLILVLLVLVLLILLVLLATLRILGVINTLVRLVPIILTLRILLVVVIVDGLQILRVVVLGTSERDAQKQQRYEEKAHGTAVYDERNIRVRIRSRRVDYGGERGDKPTMRRRGARARTHTHTRTLTNQRTMPTSKS